MTDALGGEGGATARGAAARDAAAGAATAGLEREPRTASSAAQAPRSEQDPLAQGAGDADRDVLDALTRGDRRLALALCVRRHGASIGRLCMAMLGSQGDADDVTQETLLTAHEAFSDFRGDGSVRAWLLGIARNKCLKHLEQQRRRGAQLAAAQSKAVDGASVEHAEAAAGRAEAGLGVRQRGERARALLEQIRPSERDALLLRYCSELSFKEVATACGIAEAAARKRVSRALLALRQAVGSETDDE